MVICRSEISRFWPYFSATNLSFSSLVNLQSKSINLKFDHGSEQYSKVIALLCSHKSLIFITAQSAIKINQCQCWSFFGAKFQGYSLTFWPKIAHCHCCVIRESKSMNFSFGLVLAKCQGYILTICLKWLSLINFYLESKRIKVSFGHLSAGYYLP